MDNKLALLERRLTVFEREVQALKLVISTSRKTAPNKELMKIYCDSPGFIAATAYTSEKTSDNKPFCWIGSQGVTQLILPIAPIAPCFCKIFLKMHRKIDHGDLKLVVNDKMTDFRIVYTDEWDILLFAVEESASPQIEIMFHGIHSVRPIDLGENEDARWLAFCFLKAEVAFCVEGDREEFALHEA